MSEVKDSYISIGWVKDAHGIKGEIFVAVPGGMGPWLTQIKELKLQKKEDVRRYTIRHSRPHKEGVIFQLMDVLDRNTSETLKAYEVFINEKHLVAKPGETPYLREILGFTVHDKALGPIGTVKGFSSNGSQDLLLVDYKNHEVMIPFVKVFVEEMSFKERSIKMNLPEGLVDNAF